jgi:hypothetical protein
MITEGIQQFFTRHMLPAKIQRLKKLKIMIETR